jgi:NAD(P)H-nitrite reductase large subunit
LFRSAVRMNPGIVSADRHDRQIDGTGSAQLRKRIAQRGLARKNDAAVISLENVANVMDTVSGSFGLVGAADIIVVIERRRPTPVPHGSSHRYCEGRARQIRAPQ